MFAITSVVIIAILSMCFAHNPKNWVINFKTDVEVSNSNFEEVEKWIAANNGKVVDKLNSNEYKVIIAEMDEKIHDILKEEQLGQFLDSVEDDDDYDHEDL